MTTIQDFRSDPDRYLAFREVLDHPMFEEAMAILERAAPIHNIIRQGITDVEAHITLGSERGYALYARKLREMAEPWPIKRQKAEESYGVNKE